jgi:hypothetical protein
MAAKVNTLSHAVSVLKDRGFKSQSLSYHQFLYLNEGEVRKILVWLAEQVGNAVGEGGGGSGGVGGVGGLGDTRGNVVPYLQRATGEWRAVARVRNETRAVSLAAPGGGALAAHRAAAAAAITRCSLLDDFEDCLPTAGEGASATRALRDGRPLADVATAKTRAAAARASDDLARQVPTGCRLHASLTSYAAVKELRATARRAQFDRHAADLGAGDEADFWHARRTAARDTFASLCASTVSTTAKAAAAGVAPPSMSSILARADGSLNPYTFGWMEGAPAGVDVALLKAETEEELVERRAEEVSSLEQVMSELLAEAARLAADAEAAREAADELAGRRGAEEAELAQARADLALKRKTHELLPEADFHIKRLKQESGERGAKLVALAEKYERVRGPLVARYRALLAQAGDLHRRNAQRLERVRATRALSDNLAASVADADERYRSLVDKYKSLPKEARRGAYTRRILDIVRQLKKQKVEIDKVLLSIRDLQKEINTISGTLRRTFAVAQDTVFADARGSEAGARATEAAVRIYRQLALLSDDFEQLGRTIEEAGQTRNAALSLESKIQSLQQRTEAYDLEQMSADLAQISGENETLAKKVQRAEIGVV